MRQTENYGDTVGKYEMVSGVWVNQRTAFLGCGPSGNGDFVGKIIELKWWNGWWPEGQKGPPIFDLTDLLCWLMVIPSGNRFWHWNTRGNQFVVNEEITWSGISMRDLPVPKYIDYQRDSKGISYFPAWFQYFDKAWSEFKMHQPLVIVTIGPQWAVYSMNQIVLHKEWPRDQLLSQSIWTALRMVKSEFCLVKDPCFH